MFLAEGQRSDICGDRKGICPTCRTQERGNGALGGRCGLWGQMGVSTALHPHSHPGACDVTVSVSEAHLFVPPGVQAPIVRLFSLAPTSPYTHPHPGTLSAHFL